MTRLAFRMDLLSNQVKGERFWPGFCFASSLDIVNAFDSAVSTILASLPIRVAALCFYIKRHRFISYIPLLSSPPHPFVPPRLWNARTRRIERFSKFLAIVKFLSIVDFIGLYRDNIGIGRFLEKENDTVFTALSPFECRNTAARLAFAEHFTATSRGQSRHSSLTLPWPSLRRNSDLPIPSTGHPSPFFLRAS